MHLLTQKWEGLLGSQYYHYVMPSVEPPFYKWGLGRRKEPYLSITLPVGQVVSSRMRNAEVVLLQGMKPSGWELGKGVMCSWLQQSGTESLPS